MSDIKSVNIASWGLAITALLLIIIGIEEVLTSTHILEGWALASGNFMGILAAITGVLALYCFWNSDKVYGTVFLWLFVFFAVLPFTTKFGVDIVVGGDEGLRALVTLGSHTMIVGIVLAVFTAVISAWAFTKIEGVNGKFVGGFFAALAAYALFMSIGNGMWVVDYDLTAPGDFNPNNLMYSCTNEGLANALAAVGGVAALIAGIVGIYIGFVREKFMNQPLSNGPETGEMGSFDVTAPGLLAVAFFMTLIGIYLLLSPDLGKAGGDIETVGGLIGNYWLPPVLFAVPGLSIAFLLTLFSYWNGNKKSATGFLIAGLVFTMMVICLIGVEIAGGFISSMSHVGPDRTIGNKLNVIPYVIFALFFFGVAAWVGMKSGMHKLYALVLVLVGLAFVTLALTCVIGSPTNGNMSVLSMFRTFELIAGAFVTIAGLVLLYCGIEKTEIAKLPMW